MSGPSGEITVLLRAVQSGRPGAMNELVSLIYGELRLLACKMVGQTPPQAVPPPTALVHEAYMRLFDKTQTTWEDRHHFFWAASRAMHDILVEEARKHAAQKRGGDRKQITLTDDLAVLEQSQQLMDLSEAVERLEKAAPDAARVVFLRFFGGLSHAEVADTLGISSATVRRRWTFARAWLHKELAVDSAADGCPLSASEEN